MTHQIRDKLVFFVLLEIPINSVMKLYFSVIIFSIFCIVFTREEKLKKCRVNLANYAGDPCPKTPKVTLLTVINQ